MVKRCVAAGCSNTYSDGVSLFHFPKDHARRQQWIKQVQRTRSRWKGPSEHSVLCSDHFNEDCFEPDTAIASSLGLDKPRRRLKADAVPTVFKRAAAPLLMLMKVQALPLLILKAASLRKWKGGLMRSERELGYVIFNVEMPSCLKSYHTSVNPRDGNGCRYIQ